MTSRREQILAHVATTLAPTAGIASVYRSDWTFIREA